MPDLYGLAKPLLGCIQPETAHDLALWAMQRNLVTGTPYQDDVLRTEVWGRRFDSPIGLAAGFDKDARVPEQALALGFGFVEIGTVTPHPQPGNPKPRLFRLTEDRAVINRMGFNGGGADAVRGRLQRLPAPPRRSPIGVNLGKNKETEDAAADYVIGVEKLAPLADYLVINVSSPNTPGLRALQNPAALTDLIARVQDALAKTVPDGAPPLLIKVAPDLTPEDIADIARVALDAKIDGLIATNTTIDRPASLTDRQSTETGGLSGAPLLQPSTEILAAFHKATEGRLPLIGVGGIASGVDAYAKIRAGASLVQLYSAMVFEGPNLPGRVNRTLAGLLKRDGFASVADAVGADHR